MSDDYISTRRRLEQFYREEVETYLSQIRFQDQTDPALKTVSHALLWACALMEFHKNTPGYENFRDADPVHEVVASIRYARNRALHQFTQLLKITSGGALPALLPAPFFEIEWRQLSELPPPDAGFESPQLAMAYEKRLQDCPVRCTFEALEGFFERLAAFSSKSKA